MRQSGGGSSVAEIIKKAEKQIAAGDLGRARTLLENAQKTEPHNEYINAILERVVFLEAREEEPPAQNAPGAAIEHEIAIAQVAEQMVQEDEVQIQVKRLTKMAHDQFEHGSYDSAFDSLMNAFILDPLSKEVAQAESVIVPAIELMKKRGTLSVTSDENRPTTTQILQRGLSPNGPISSDPVSRLDQLKQQKEQERLMREREMWRKASGAPRMADADDDPISAADAQLVPPTPQKHRDGLFSRLRGGLHIG